MPDRNPAVPVRGHPENSPCISFEFLPIHGDQTKQCHIPCRGTSTDQANLPPKPSRLPPSTTRPADDQFLLCGYTTTAKRGNGCDAADTSQSRCPRTVTCHDFPRESRWDRESLL